MHEGHGRHKRRNYLINPQFQLTVMGFFVGMATVTIIVFFWSVRMVFENFRETVRSLSLPPDHMIAIFVAENERAMNTIFASTSVLLFLFLVVGGLVLSHHIAGPIYRLKKHIELVASGEPFGDLMFRRKDFFMDVLPEYNRMLARIREWKGS